MRAMGSWCGSVLVAAMLAACGGGGGSSGATGGNTSGNSGSTTPAPQPVPPVNAAGSWLTFAPSTLAVTTTAGQSKTFSITATSSRTIEKQFSIAIVETNGVISPQVQVNPISQFKYEAELRTASSLTVGTYSTTLEVRLCEDDPLVCNVPLPGSPWRLPLTVTVRPAG